jgi:hypothetical protein
MPTMAPTIDIRRCTALLDFLFLQDESESITPAQWIQGKNFMRGLTKRFFPGRRCVPLQDDDSNGPNLTSAELEQYPACTDESDLTGTAGCGTEKDCFRAGEWKTRIGLATFSGIMNLAQPYGCENDLSLAGNLRVNNASNAAIERFSLSTHVDATSLRRAINDTEQRCGETYTKEGFELIKEMLERSSPGRPGGDCRWRRVAYPHNIALGCKGPHKDGVNCWFDTEDPTLELVRDAKGYIKEVKNFIDDINIDDINTADSNTTQNTSTEGAGYSVSSPETPLPVVRQFAVVITDGEPTGGHEPQEAYESLREACDVEVITIAVGFAESWRQQDLRDQPDSLGYKPNTVGPWLRNFYGPMALGLSRDESETTIDTTRADQWDYVIPVEAIEGLDLIRRELEDILCNRSDLSRWPVTTVPTSPPTIQSFSEFNNFSFDEETYKCFKYDDQLGPTESRVDSCSVFGKDTSPGAAADATQTCDLCGTTDFLFMQQLVVVAIGMLADWLSDRVLATAGLQILAGVVAGYSVNTMTGVLNDETCFGEDSASTTGRTFFTMAFSSSFFGVGGVCCVVGHFKGKVLPKEKAKQKDTLFVTTAQGDRVGMIQETKPSALSV